MNGEDLMALWVQSAQQGKDPLYEVHFKNGIVAVVRLERH